MNDPNKPIRNRPLTIKEIYASAASISKTTYLSILKAILIVFVPFYFGRAYVYYDLTTRGADPSRDPGFAVLSFIWFLAHIFVTLAVIGLVQSSLDHREMTWREAMKKSSDRLGIALITSFVQNAILIALTLLLVVPGIIWAVYYTFIWQSVMLNRKDYLEALNDSKALVKGRWWQVAGYFLSFTIPAFSLVLIYEFILGFVMGILQWDSPGLILLFFTEVLSPLLRELMLSWLTVAITIYYLNLSYLKDPGKDFSTG